jgi:hypothetical protein
MEILRERFVPVDCESRFPSACVSCMPKMRRVSFHCVLVVNMWAFSLLLIDVCSLSLSLCVSVSLFLCTPAQIFENIITYQVEWLTEDEISEVGFDLLTLLMCFRSEDRLGVNGADEVKQHAFFANVNWGALLTTKAAFIPRADSATDTTSLGQNSSRDTSMSSGRCRGCSDGCFWCSFFCCTCGCLWYCCSVCASIAAEYTWV